MKATTRRAVSFPVAPGVAVGWVLIGALVLVYSPESESLGMIISLFVTSVTVVIVHFFAEVFLGHHMLSKEGHTFKVILKKESIASLWMALWMFPALIPAYLYGADLLGYQDTLLWTSRIIQFLAGVMGFLIATVRGVRMWRRILIAIVFVLVITAALLIEAITHILVAVLH